MRASEKRLTYVEHMESMAMIDSKGWFVCFRPAERVRLRLLCLPYAGGGVAAYHAWSRLLPPDIEVYALVMPGRDSRAHQPPFRHLLPLVHALIEAVAPSLRDRPFAVFGHSLGALVGFESIRLLEREYGCKPMHFFASAQVAPQCLRQLPPIHTLSDVAFIHAVKERYQGIPQAVLDEPALLKLFLPILKADFSLLETYKFLEGPQLQCPITGLWGIEDAIATGPQVEAWRLQTASFSSHALSGGHFFIRQCQEAVIKLVAQTIEDSTSAL